jgi:hypothetical protein
MEIEPLDTELSPEIKKHIELEKWAEKMRSTVLGIPAKYFNEK